jgi:hypothetical protein
VIGLSSTALPMSAPSLPVPPTNAMVGVIIVFTIAALSSLNLFFMITVPGVADALPRVSSLVHQGTRSLISF